MATKDMIFFFCFRSQMWRYKRRQSRG
jgi:hypothetical protein